jgi:hypothetical protein
VNRGALRTLALLVLLGSLGCSSEITVRRTPDDAASDAVWAAIARGDLPAADRAAASLTDPELHERARLDVLAARQGRSAACAEALDAGSWLAARFDASGERARGRLRDQRRREPASAAVWIEEARRSEDAGRALSAIRAAESLAPGGVEAAAIEVELLGSQRRFAEAEKILSQLLDGARLHLARARLLASTGRLDAACEHLLSDLHDGLAVPASIALLQDILLAVPLQDREHEALATLQSAPISGSRMERAQRRLLAVLTARRGNLDGAIAQLGKLELPSPDDEAVLALWTARREGGEPPAVPLERRIDADPDRPRSPALRERRIADEWDLAARKAYDDEDEGKGTGLDGFLARLDAAAAPLRDAPQLAALPRRDFGIFGDMLDTDPLRASLPDAVVLCGKALSLPADIACFDRVECTSRELPDGAGPYEECHVRRPRVTGYAASRGASITGAGLDPLVWLDLDQFQREELGDQLTPCGPPLPARPAAGRAARLDLSEPLDVARWLDDAARAADGARYDALRLDALSQHEQQHILDFRNFVAEGTAGKIGMLLSGGVFPSSVRAEVERRAQLHALRTCGDPRLALSHALSHLPAEGAARNEAHAAGYDALITEFLRRLDDAAWPGAKSVEDLGLDRSRNLVQQLWKLDPDTIRAIALGMDD